MTHLNLQRISAHLLRPNPWNPNRVDARALDQLKVSLERLGNFKPIIVRETDDGLEVLGGWHRTYIAQEANDDVDIVNLGLVDDQRAKEISLLDNVRFGYDESELYSNLLHSLEIDLSELSTFMPGHFEDIQFDMGVEVDLETLGIETKTPDEPVEKSVPTHTTLRFRVPIADAHIITERVQAVIDEQGFDGASAEAAGDGLLYIFTNEL